MSASGSPPQGLEFQGPEGPEILVLQIARDANCMCCKLQCCKLHMLQIARFANCTCYKLDVLQIACVVMEKLLAEKIRGHTSKQAE